MAPVTLKIPVLSTDMLLESFSDFQLLLLGGDQRKESRKVLERIYGDRFEKGRQLQFTNPLCLLVIDYAMANIYYEPAIDK